MTAGSSPLDLGWDLAVLQRTSACPSRLLSRRIMSPGTKAHGWVIGLEVL